MTPAVKRRAAVAVVIGLSEPFVSRALTCREAAVDRYAREACRWATANLPLLLGIGLLVSAPLVFGALTLLAAAWRRALVWSGRADPAVAAPRGAATLGVAYALFYAGGLALSLLAGLWIYGLFFMPQTEEYQGFGMMIALLPFWIVPWAVPALVVGLVLRGRALRARGR